MDPKKDFPTMSWMLLEYNLFYFKEEQGISVHPDWRKYREITDEEFDEKEDQYEALAKILGEDSTAVEDISFDMSKGSRRLVAQKMGKEPHGIMTWPKGYDNLDSNASRSSKDKLVEDIRELLEKGKNRGEGIA